MRISDAVVVGVSEPGEKRWGRFQFPCLGRIPGGELMISINDGEDATGGYGHPPRRFFSADGKAWRPADRAIPGRAPHANCAELFDGEYLIMPSAKTFDTVAAGLSLPEPVGKALAYVDFFFRRVADCPPPVREYLTRIDAWRWTPACPAWTAERVAYEIPGQLCWTVQKELTVSRTWFERKLLRRGKELLYVDYRINCLRDDGTAPAGFSCVLMVSDDNGHSFHKRSVVTSGRVYEPMLAETANGGLICVSRGTDQEQLPMLVTHSADGGHTWETPQPLFDFGVFPAIIRLENGVLLLAFGRPGVWVSASLDGSGRTWTPPQPVLQGNPKALMECTCGYTDWLATDRDEAMLVYSNFNYQHPDGSQRKSIEIRKVSVSC